MIKSLGKGIFGGSSATVAYLVAVSEPAKSAAFWAGMLVTVLTALKIGLELSQKYLGWPKPRQQMEQTARRP
jgi:hypothetical protein